MNKSLPLLSLSALTRVAVTMTWFKGNGAHKRLSKAHALPLPCATWGQVGEVKGQMDRGSPRARAVCLVHAIFCFTDGKPRHREVK